MTVLFWVAPQGMAHNFIELDKAVVHVISLIHFLWLWFFILSVLWVIRIRGLWKHNGRDWLWGKLVLFLMGGAMLSKFLIQFSVDGWGCVPFLLLISAAQSCLTLWDPMDCSSLGFPVHHPLLELTQNSCPLSWWCHPTISSSVVVDLIPNYIGGNEDNGDLLQKAPCLYCCTQCPWPCSRPLPTHASARDSWRLTGKSGSVSCGVTAPFSWVLHCRQILTNRVIREAHLTSRSHTHTHTHTQILIMSCDKGVLNPISFPQEWVVFYFCTFCFDKRYLPS